MLLKQVLAGVPTLDQAIDAYIEKMAKQSPYFIVAQDLNKITVDGQTEDQMSFIGITASFDGTSFHTVQSLNDLFSGGKIGHLITNLWNLLLLNKLNCGNNSYTHGGYDIRT